MRGVAWAGMLLAAACSSKDPAPLAACDAFITAVEKVAACPTVSSEARLRLTTSTKTMRATITQLEQGGGPSKAPPELVRLLRDSCRAQLASLLDEPTYAACAK